MNVASAHGAARPRCGIMCPFWQILWALPHCLAGRRGANFRAGGIFHPDGAFPGFRASAARARRFPAEGGRRTSMKEGKGGISPVRIPWRGEARGTGPFFPEAPRAAPFPTGEKPIFRSSASGGKEKASEIPGDAGNETRLFPSAHENAVKTGAAATQKKRGNVRNAASDTDFRFTGESTRAGSRNMRRGPALSRSAFSARGFFEREIGILRLLWPGTRFRAGKG